MNGTFDLVCGDTRKLPRPEWLALRKTGIGSSDAAPAMSMSPWTSAYSLWAEKRGIFPETPDNERFLWGRLQEPIILDQALARGWISAPAGRGLMLRSHEYPWMLANPDALTPVEVVEAKTADAWDEARWEIGVPDHYAIQAHHLMVVTGRRTCHFPVLFGGNSFRGFDVDWDERLATTVIEATCDMWERIIDNEPPDPDGSEATMLALRAQYADVVEGKVVDLPEHARPWFYLRDVSAGVVAKHAKQVDEVKAQLMALMGDGEVGKLDGQVVCTWKANKNGKRTFLFKESK